MRKQYWKYIAKQNKKPKTLQNNVMEYLMVSYVLYQVI